MQWYPAKQTRDRSVYNIGRYKKAPLIFLFFFYKKKPPLKSITGQMEVKRLHAARYVVRMHEPGRAQC